MQQNHNSNRSFWTKKFLFYL